MVEKLVVDCCVVALPRVLCVCDGVGCSFCSQRKGGKTFFAGGKQVWFVYLWFIRLVAVWLSVCGMSENINKNAAQVVPEIIKSP